MAHKKNTWKTTNANNTNIPAAMDASESECLEMIEMYKKMEEMNGLKLLPIDDYKKLGVAYHCMDVNGEISITFFDRTKCSSAFDVFAKAAAGKNTIVGEDCVYYPAQTVGAAIVPNWGIQSMFGMIMGTMNFDTFVARSK